MCFLFPVGIKTNMADILEASLGVLKVKVIICQ